MAKYNPRLAKINRAYKIEQIADLFGIHKQTVFNWIKAGLPVCVKERPQLIHGQELRAFLEQRYRKNKRPCRPGHLFCVACKIPQYPVSNFAMVVRLDLKRGDLVGECPRCHRYMHRVISLNRPKSWQGSLDLSWVQDQ